MDIIISAQKMGEIEGIFHLAMILKDRLFTNLTIEEFSEVVETKYLMAKHFDKLTRIVCLNLEYFVVFSSIASQIGKFLNAKVLNIFENINENLKFLKFIDY
jgi:hypothetical protein